MLKHMRNLLGGALLAIALGIPYLQAADVAISALPAGTTLTGTEAIPAVQSAATVKTTPAAIKTYVETGGTVTASDPVLDLSQTWNNAAVAFTALKLDVTNTGSSAVSKLFDLQVGGSSVAHFRRDGSLQLGASTAISGASGAFIVDYAGYPALTVGNAFLSGVTFHDLWSYGWGDLRVYRDAADTLALRRGANAQTFRVYNTYTDASNHARLTVSAGVLDSASLQIIGERAGTGTYTNVDIGYSATKLLRQNGTNATLFGQHFVSFSDNTYDIGSSSAGWRTGYFDTSVITPTIANAGTSILAATRLRADGFATALTSKTADYTATATDTTILVDASGAARTITLPAASGISGRIYVIKKTDSSGNAVTVDANASETIDGATTYALSAQYKFVVIQCDGTNWHIIGAN